MRFEWETRWWRVDAKEVGESLAGYYDNLQRCLDQLREGRELKTGLAHFRFATLLAQAAPPPTIPNPETAAFNSLGGYIFPKFTVSRASIA
jgi:hypothetical protein